MLDKPKKLLQHPYEQFIQQASDDAKLAGSPFWMLISKRDGRDAVVTIPRKLFDALCGVGAFKTTPRPYFTMKLVLRQSKPLTKAKKSKLKHRFIKQTICGCSLEGFFTSVKPEHFINIAKNL